MKLEQYLIHEGGEVENLNYIPAKDLAIQIKHDCKKYLKLIGGRKGLWRGISFGSAIGKKKVRQNRHAMGTSDIGYDLANDWLAKKKWPRRDKSVICTSDLNWAEDFGVARMIFPIGSNYGYAWVESSDFNDYGIAGPMDRMPRGWSTGHFENFAEVKPELAEQMLEEFVHGNKHFNMAYNRRYEIWFDCKEFYFIGIRALDAQYKNEYIKAFREVGIQII